MYTTDDIREIDFSTSMSGYKKSEVDDFLDKLADDYEQLTKENQQLKQQLKKSAASSGDSAAVKPAAPSEPDLATTENVQSILTSAQRFSDQLIFEAKQKAEAMLTDAAIKAKEIEDKIATDKAQTEESIAKLKEETEQTVTTVLKGANDKSESIVLAAKDSVERQQMLFDKLRVEADLFKTKLVDSYKKQLELLADFPVEVPFDSVHASKAVEFIIDNKPDFNSFIKNDEQASEDDAIVLNEAEEPQATEDTPDEVFDAPETFEYKDEQENEVEEDNKYVIEDHEEKDESDDTYDLNAENTEESSDDDKGDKKGFMYLFNDED